jgi:ATPase subunit of ABC transporter with duplicated ATPase domains
LAAINAAIHEEEAAGLADTNYYRDLLTQRAEAVRQEAEEEAKVKDAAIKQSMAAMDKAMQEQNRHSAAMSKIATPKSADDSAAKAAELNQEYAAKHAELMKELADTQSMGVAKVAAQQRINAELEELDKEHQNRMAENAALRVQQENAAAMSVANSWGQSMLKVAQGHESMEQVAARAFSSMISNSLEAALMEVAHEKTAQLAHAEAAAAAAWHSMSNIPVIGPALGAAAAAATFAGAMAFQEGGIVPGTGVGDIVPAMLEPGEGVIPKSLMESMKNGNGGAPSNHYTVNAPIHMNASALDADGVDEVFEKHASKIQKHFENTLRKMNR